MMKKKIRGSFLNFSSSTALAYNGSAVQGYPFSKADVYKRQVPSIALSATNSYFSKSLPLADKLGWFGQIFLYYGFLAYLAVAIALIAAYVLKHTRVGLHLSLIHILCLPQLQQARL